MNKHCGNACKSSNPALLNEKLILLLMLLFYDKKHNQDKAFLKMVLKSLRKRTKSIDLNKIEISKPDKKNFIYGESNLNPEIFKVIINTVN